MLLDGLPSDISDRDTPTPGLEPNPGVELVRQHDGGSLHEDSISLHPSSRAAAWKEPLEWTFSPLPPSWRLGCPRSLIGGTSRSMRRRRSARFTPRVEQTHATSRSIRDEVSQSARQRPAQLCHIGVLDGIGKRVRSQSSQFTSPAHEMVGVETKVSSGSRP